MLRNGTSTTGYSPSLTDGGIFFAPAKVVETVVFIAHGIPERYFPISTIAYISIGKRSATYNPRKLWIVTRGILALKKSNSDCIDGAISDDGIRTITLASEALDLVDAKHYINTASLSILYPWTSFNRF